MKSVPCPNRKTIENSEHLEDIWYVFSGRWYFQTKRPFCVSVFKFRWFFRRVWLVSKEGSKSTLVTFDFAPNGCFPCCYVRERRVARDPARRFRLVFFGFCRLFSWWQCDIIWLAFIAFPRIVFQGILPKQFDTKQRIRCKNDFQSLQSYVAFKHINEEQARNLHIFQ